MCGAYPEEAVGDAGLASKSDLLHIDSNIMNTNDGDKLQEYLYSENNGQHIHTDIHG
jgi:hypothetical protein